MLDIATRLGYTKSIEHQKPNFMIVNEIDFSFNIIQGQ